MGKVRKVAKRALSRSKNSFVLANVIPWYEKERQNRRNARFDAYVNAYKDIDRSLANAKENTRVIMLDAQDVSEDSPAITLDVLGAVSDFKNRDLESFESLLSAIDEGAQAHILPSTEALDAACAEVRAKLEAENLFILEPGKAILFDNGNFKTYIHAFYAPECAEEEVRDTIKTCEPVNQLLYASELGADYVISYLLRDSEAGYWLTPTEIALRTALANLGSNYIISANERSIRKGSTVRRKDRIPVPTIFSMGFLFGREHEFLTNDELQDNRYETEEEKELEDENTAEESEDGEENEESDDYAQEAEVRFNYREKTAIALRLSLYATEKGAVLNQGIIPLYINKPEDDNSVSDGAVSFIRLTRKRSFEGNFEHARYFDYVMQKMLRFRDVTEVLTLGKLFETIGVELPSKYAYMKNMSVGRVCARTFEVGPGDVFFFRQPFNDVNDKEVQSDLVRLRMVSRAMGRGAAFVFSYLDLNEDIPHVKIEDPREAHIKALAYLRSLLDVRYIAITGSVGKTSTKDMLTNVFRQHYVTKKNNRNTNTQVKIAMHIQKVPARCEVFIQELGGGRPGGASRHSRMISPEACVITNIGFAHIGNFGTQEALMENKLGVADGMDENGILFLNGDDPLLISAKSSHTIVYYALENKNADYYAENIRIENGMNCFDIVHGNHRVAAHLNVLGDYNVLNAVCCYAIAKSFDIPDEEIVDGIAQFKTRGIRQNLVKVSGYNLFLDCFNASLGSIESSLSVLDSIQTDAKRIAVLGDLTGASDRTEEMHVLMGETVQKHNADLFICYGKECERVYNMALTAGKKAIHVNNYRELKKALAAEAHEGDYILFKGSSKNHFSEMIDDMYGMRNTDENHIDGAKYRKVTKNNIQYYAFGYGATVWKVPASVEEFVLAKRVNGVTVRALGSRACTHLNKEIQTVTVPNGIQHIGKYCFKGCEQLETVHVCGSVKYVDTGAFKKCTNLKSITFDEGLIHMEDGIFAGCTALETVTLPASLRQMGNDVFNDCEKVYVVCPQGSYAQKYCEENGIKYSYC